MGFYIEKYNPSWCSYIPVILRVFPLSAGPVLELGTGLFSTPLLHMMCLDKNRSLVSYENSREFFELNQAFINDLHQVKFVDDWDKIDIDTTRWGMALVDHKPAGRRVDEIKRLAHTTDYIIIHDSEPSQNHHYHYDLIYPLFKYRFDYTDKPHYAHTAVLSNSKDLTNLYSSASDSMLGKWDQWYARNIRRMTSFRYGHTVTYQLAEDFLKGLKVEDWGCGAGAFKRLHRGGYLGLDGSKTPFVDKVVDLRDYRSNVDGIMMRHVLEHNYDWAKVLDNAIASFKKKFCLVLFTPFSDRTQVIAQNKKYGVDVPTISFNKKDLERHLHGLKWKLTEGIATGTFYGTEHIYYVER